MLNERIKRMEGEFLKMQRTIFASAGIVLLFAAVSVAQQVKTDYDRSAVAQGVAKEELRREEWLRCVAQLSDRSYEQMRVAILEFLDIGVFNVSMDSCISLLDPMIDSWDIDLKTFGMEVVLNRRVALGSLKRFEFVEQEPQQAFAIEPGFEQFLMDKSLSGNATEEEIEFLKMLKFKGRRPAPRYYYRELQNLRDPLHFPATEQLKEQFRTSG
jgi:hypothetical protein